MRRSGGTSSRGWTGWKDVIKKEALAKIDISPNEDCSVLIVGRRGSMGVALAWPLYVEVNGRMFDCISAEVAAVTEPWE